MSQNIIKIQDSKGNDYLPQTVGKAVTLYNGTNLDDTVAEIKKDLESVGEGGVGKSLEGETVEPMANVSYTAEAGAEIFNDYDERTFSQSADDDYVALTGNVAEGEKSSAFGKATTAVGDYSHSEGLQTMANGKGSHAEGYWTVSNGDYSHAEGKQSTATGTGAHSEGYNTAADGIGSHSEGSYTNATGYGAHAGGSYSSAIGSYAFAHGRFVTANAYQTVLGKHNNPVSGPSTAADTTGSLFVFGCGTSENSLENALRITADGTCYGKTSFKGSGADYARYFEWADGNPSNEDRRGLFVALDGKKIKLASPGDERIIGVISANPAFVENVQSELWHEKYLKDVFGSPIKETVTVPESIDEVTKEIIPEHTEVRFKLNPAYDPSKEYVSREFRSEWEMVGLFGTLVAVDDGTCEVNGYCTVGQNGVGTKSEEKTRYIVMDRIDNNHIELFLGF